MQKEEREIKKYAFWIISAILIIASYFIIKPFIAALISSFILAFLIKPVYESLSKKINKHLSALVSLLLIIMIIIIPFIIILSMLGTQIYSSLNASEIKESVEKLSSMIPGYDINLDSIINKIISFSLSLIGHLPNLALNIIIMLFGIYYILLNWNELTNATKKYLPFDNKEKISNELSETTKNLVYGYLLMALIEFTIAAIGFYIAGVKLFILLAALIGLAALIPGIGPAAVWIPTAIYYIMQSNYTTAIIVAVTGLIITLFIENIVYAKLVGKKAKIHPIIILLGVFGGVPLFGILGVIIGPLLLVYTIKFIEEAMKEKER